MTGPEEDGNWQSAALPLVTEQGYIVAALYGELVSHPWRDSLDTSHPLFLFDHRSNDMGWTYDRHESNSLWKVFEAPRTGLHDRKVTAGKAPMEAMRALKRRLSDVVYQLVTDQKRRRRNAKQTQEEEPRLAGESKSSRSTSRFSRSAVAQ